MNGTVKHLFALMAILTIGVAQAQQAPVRQTPDQYIAKWSDVARVQMVKYGVPASITLAQGILESGSGNSDLARKANNHFGIKCHGWKGRTYHKDDDRPNECFRAYESADSSFEDHSKFLVNGSRYSFLFDLKPTDYKGWAKGLSKAGYATSRTYSTKLIDLVERYDLAKYDRELQKVKDPVLISKASEVKEEQAQQTASARQVELYHDRVAFIRARKGDTYYRIAKEFEMGIWQLYRYNDLGKTDVLKEGDVIFLQPKRNRAHRQSDREYVCKGGETMSALSQRFAIKLKKLAKFNPNLEANSDLAQGEVVRLRP